MFVPSLMWHADLAETHHVLLRTASIVLIKADLNLGWDQSQVKRAQYPKACKVASGKAHMLREPPYLLQMCPPKSPGGAECLPAAARHPPGMRALRHDGACTSGPSGFRQNWTIELTPVGPLQHPWTGLLSAAMAEGSVSSAKCGMLVPSTGGRPADSP